MKKILVLESCWDMFNREKQIDLVSEYLKEIQDCETVIVTIELPTITM